MNINIQKDIDFLVIVGPTASGKTALSLEIAKKYNGEIINGDSVQVYKGLDIGSAKIKKKDMQNVVHHLLDIKKPDEEYSVHDFQKDCESKIKKIKAKGKLPIIVGGTGLYISSVAYGYKLTKTEINQEVKAKLEKLSNEELFDIIKDTAKEQKIEIHINNRIRLLNYAYKVCESIPLKETKKNKKNCQILCMDVDRKILYDKINKRVDQMIDQGLVEEVKKYKKDMPSQKAIGYKEVHMYLIGEYTYDQMIDKIKQHTRNFAKKQMTWFRNQMDVDLIKVD